jgi:hypothetical protein
LQVNDSGRGGDGRHLSTERVIAQVYDPELLEAVDNVQRASEHVVRETERV